MKSHESFEEFIERTSVDLYDWPNSPDELVEFLEISEDEPIAQDAHEARVSIVLEQIAESSPSVRTVQKSLWEQPDDENAQCPVDIHEVVKDAYLEMYDGWSTDRVVADPDRNSLFIQSCWSRGITASQYELNKLLLNARKSKKLGKVEGVKAYRVPREVMDQYELASEAAVRLLQDREHYANQRWISLDDILCDPKLGKQFFEIATSLAPGFNAVDYRWAALSIRKAINRRPKTGAELDCPQFAAIGSRDRIRASSLSREAGFFRMKSQDLDFYVGHTGNLRDQMERLLDSDIDETLACYNTHSLFESGPLTYSIASVPALAVSDRNPIKRLLVNELEPRLNITMQGGKARKMSGAAVA